MENGIVIGATGEVSAAMLKELFSLIDRKVVTKENLQNFIKKPYLYAKKTTLNMAYNILGKEKIVSFHQSRKIWNLTVDEQVKKVKDPDIVYNEEILREAALANENDTADFYLIYINGLSIDEQSTVLGKKLFRDNPSKSIDYLKTAQGVNVVKQKSAPGYYLINMRPYNVNIEGNLRPSFEDEEASIRELGHSIRTDENIFIEAVISIFKKHNHKKALDFYHRGPTVIVQHESNSMVSKKIQSSLVIGHFRKLQMDFAYLLIPRGGDAIQSILTRKYN